MCYLNAALDSNSNVNARINILEEEFVSFGKAFLSALAVAEIEDLEKLCPMLLPHKVTFSLVSNVYSQTPQNRVLPQRGLHEDRQLLSPIAPYYNVPSASSDPQLPTETHLDRSLFATYTTLADEPHSTTVDVAADTEFMEIRHGREAQNYIEMPMVPTPAQALYVQAETVSQVEAGNVHNIMSPTAESFPCPRYDCIPTLPLTSQLNDLQSAILPTSNPPGLTFSRAYTNLTIKYGNHHQESLAAETIMEIMKVGDRFLRDDMKNFVELCSHGWSQDGILHRPPLAEPTPGSSMIIKLIHRFCCAEILEKSCAVDPVKLRMARVALYHYYELLCIDAQSDPSLLSRRSRGRNITSIITDKIVEDMYGSSKDQVDMRTWKSRRESLQKHKKIGKRWCMLAEHLGAGILLICHPGLGTKINDTTFTEVMISALLMYIINTFPQGVGISRMLDSLVKSLIEGKPLSIPWIKETDGKALSEYSQLRELHSEEWNGEWQAVETPAGFVQIL